MKEMKAPKSPQSCDPAGAPPECAKIPAQHEAPSADPHAQPENDRIQHLIKQVGVLTAQVQSLQDRVEPAKEENHINNGKCTCPDEDFVPVNLQALVESAEDYYRVAVEKAAKAKQERNFRRMTIVHCLTNLLANASFVAMAKYNDENKKNLAEAVSSMAEDLADEIIAKENPEISDIVDLFEEKAPIFRFLGYEDIIRERPEEFEQLLSTANAHEPIKTYLKKLMKDIVEMGRMNLSVVWREKFPSYKPGTPEMEGELGSIRQSAQKADEYCAAIYGPESLHEKVRDMDNLDDLQKILASVVPSAAENYHYLVSAVAKTNMMHLAEVIRTQIDFSRISAATEHLRKRLAAYTEKTRDGIILKCASDGNPDHFIEVAAVNVAEQKNDIAIARKFISKDLQFTKDFDLAGIHDLVRFEVVLSEEDSSSPQRIEAATKKIIGILCAIFGTDVSQERLRESFTTGKTNEHSTGDHEAFHLTFRERNQCRASGLNRHGTAKLDIISVEVQIRKHMYPEQLKEDHRIYKDRKDAKIRKLAGLDVSFIAFVSDLCDAILNYKCFPKVCKKTGSGFERSLKEKLQVILLSILTKRSPDGEMSNIYSIKQICEDPHLLKKVLRVIEECEKTESSIFTAQRSEIALLLQGDRAEIIRRILREVGKKARAEKISNERSSRSINPAVDEAKLRQMNKEQLLELLFRGYGGWREKVYEKMPEAGHFFESSPNILARKAGQVLESFDESAEQGMQTDGNRNEAP